jgi:hypothetical protein
VFPQEIKAEPSEEGNTEVRHWIFLCSIGLLPSTRRPLVSGWVLPSGDTTSVRNDIVSFFSKKRMEENNEPIHEQLNKTGSLAKASSSNTASKFRIDDSEEETPEPSTTTTSFLQDSSDEEDPQGVETTTTASAPSKKSTGKFMPNLGVKRNKTKQMDQEIIIEPQAATLKRDRPRFNDADLMVASGPFSMGPAVKGAQPSAAKPSGAAMPRQGGSGGGGGSSQGKGSSRDAKGKGGASTSIKEDDEDEDMYMPIGGPVVGHKGILFSFAYNVLAVDYGKKVIADKKIVAPRLEDELDKFDPFARYEDMAEDMDEDDAFDEWDVDSPVKPGGLTGGLFGVDEGGIGKVLTDAGVCVFEGLIVCRMRVGCYCFSFQLRFHISLKRLRSSLKQRPVRKRRLCVIRESRTRT